MASAMQDTLLEAYGLTPDTPRVLSLPFCWVSCPCPTGARALRGGIALVAAALLALSALSGSAPLHDGLRCLEIQPSAGRALRVLGAADLRAMCGVFVDG